MQIIDRIAEKISKDNMSVLKLSNETGISAYKIYKWLGKKGNPKHDDSVKLEQWLSGNLEKVQSEPDTEAKTDRDATIAALQFQNLQLRLDKIETNLKECLSNQAVIMRQVAVAMHLAAARYAGPDKKKLDEELGKIDKLISSVHE